MDGRSTLSEALSYKEHVETDCADKTTGAGGWEILTAAMHGDRLSSIFRKIIGHIYKQKVSRIKNLW